MFIRGRTKSQLLIMIRAHVSTLACSPSKPMKASYKAGLHYLNQSDFKLRANLAKILRLRRLYRSECIK